MKNEICCIIISYNNGCKLKKCVKSIEKQVNEIIIIDNGSDNETIEYLNLYRNNEKVKIILNGENLGIAYALNQGVRYAIHKKYNWILTSDNDSEADPNMVSNISKVYLELPEKEQERVASLFPTYIEKETGVVIGNKIEKEYCYCNNDITSGNLVKLEVFDKVGMYDEKLFIDYVDHEFCYRLLENNYKLIKVRDALLNHSLGETKQSVILGKRIAYTNHSALRRYYITRNRVYTWNKYKNLNLLQALDKKNFIKESIKIILFEKNKYEKFKMMLIGYKHFKNNKYGAYKS